MIFAVFDLTPLTLSMQFFYIYLLLLEMWANVQRDGRPVEYRWRPLFNAAVWLTPECRAVTLPRRETRCNYLECPKLTKRSQPYSEPKFTIL